MDSDSPAHLVYSDDLKVYEEDLVRLMGPDGPFAKVVNGYNGRPMQLEMAQAIAKAIVRCETLVAEAGTGTGQDLCLSGSGTDVGWQGHHFDRNAQFAGPAFSPGHSDCQKSTCFAGYGRALERAFQLRLPFASGAHG